jgi:hypothetical protein
MSVATHFKLNTGAAIPAAGLGERCIIHLHDAVHVPGRYLAVQARGSRQRRRSRAQMWLQASGLRSCLPEWWVNRLLLAGDCADPTTAETEVGEAIKQSGVPREEIFITGKVCVCRGFKPCKCSG